MTLDAPDGARARMLETNQRQKAFYEAHHSARLDHYGLSLGTRAWRGARARLYSFWHAAEIDVLIDDLHRGWMQQIDLGSARVLDLGCGKGNPLSFWLAERCQAYVAIDLSEPAVAFVNAQLRERGLENAHAYAQDFLRNSFPDASFDLIYACAVLHHFEDLDVALREIHRILKPGGIIVSVDTMMTEPVNRLARRVYRSRQTDRDWEFPFRRQTFAQLRRHFQIVDGQGLNGFAKFGFPFFLLPVLNRIGTRIARWGTALDRRTARGLTPAFFLCWQCTLLMQKPR